MKRWDVDLLKKADVRESFQREIEEEMECSKMRGAS